MARSHGCRRRLGEIVSEHCLYAEQGPAQRFEIAGLLANGDDTIGQRIVGHPVTAKAPRATQAVGEPTCNP